MSWHRVKSKKPTPGVAVLVFEPADRNQYTAWWDGKRWWQWDLRDWDLRDWDLRDGLLPFKPTWWCELPPHPSDDARKASGR